jgi:protein-L-isoaspartate O-methyltransferase
MKQIAQWGKKEKPMPPPHAVKQQTIQYYAEKYNVKTLIETGTYYMVEAMRDVFAHICSIELSRELYEKAKRRFGGSGGDRQEPAFGCHYYPR